LCIQTKLKSVELILLNCQCLPMKKCRNYLKNQSRRYEAREKFIQGNLRLVLSIIQRFNRRGENVDDLFQVGCIGLIKAIDNFDLNQNVRFSTYAVPMIIGEIRRYLRDNNPIRVSRSLRDIAYKALQARDHLVNKNLKEPTITEIAEELNLPKEEIVLPWMQFKNLFPYLSLYITIMAMPYM